MTKRHRYGRISEATAAKMRANLPVHCGPVLDLLTDKPTHAARQQDDEFRGLFPPGPGDSEPDEEFRHLFAPRTFADYDRQIRRNERIAASARPGDDDLEAAIWGPES